jgi:FdhD protein
MEDNISSLLKVKEIIYDNAVIHINNVEKYVVDEISLKIYVNGTEFASLLCLNQLLEELALGFLYCEGIIDVIDEVTSIAYNDRLHAVMIELVPSRAVEKRESLRSLSSGCGKCFTYINPMKEDKFKPIKDNKVFDIVKILDNMKIFLYKSEIFKAAGGVHSCLLQNDDISLFSEDIGRHNCIDKIAGILLKDRKVHSAGKCIMYISGRVSSEIIAKVVRLTIPVIVSRSTPTASAVNLAKKYNIALLGYIRNYKGYIYTCDDKIKY